MRVSAVPFFGLAAKMLDMPILDTTDVALGPKLPFIAAGEDIATGPATYSTSNPPTVYFRLAGQSEALLSLSESCSFSSTDSWNSQARRRSR